MSTNEERILNPVDPVDPPKPADRACESLPDLVRMRYAYGMMLTAADFQKEQDYFREKLKLDHRCLDGYGTVCGLKVVPAEIYQPLPTDPIEVSQYDDRATPAGGRVQIECGLALDCEGNELLVRNPLTVDLWKELTDGERDRISKDGTGTIYVSICYCVQAIDPVRPVIPDSCGGISEECVYSRLRDSVRVKVATAPPAQNRCGEACCNKCPDKCLLLAKIDFVKGKPVTDALIHNDVRRWLTRYEPVTVTGIDWFHCAGYTFVQARKLLKNGLTVFFSRPVLSETITDGVFDVWVIEGGRGRAGNIYNMAGRIDIATSSSGTTDFVTFVQTTGETLQEGDRVLINLRTNLILDECCRSVDGEHTGGRVPFPPIDKPAGPFPDSTDRLRNGKSIGVQRLCLTPPQRYGPWVSGNGSSGGTFESWFYIVPEPGSDETVDAGVQDGKVYSAT